MMEYWNTGRKNKTINPAHIFHLPIIPMFYYSIIPVLRMG